MKKISIIIPVYNEDVTVEKVLNRVLEAQLPLKKEIVIIDDGSTDNSKEIIEKWIKMNGRKAELKFVSKENGGKGSAVKKGIEHSSGDIITVQDADLEYDPQEYSKLLEPIIKGDAKVVYGSRFLKEHKPMYRLFFMGNKFLTLLTKVLYGSTITDMETCYKVFDSKLLKSFDIKANKFDIEPEITARILKSGHRIKEIPISYVPRSMEEGKKINWKDGVQAIFTLVYWKFK